MNSNELVINTEVLSKSFGAVQALKSLDLRVPQKSIFAFLGPNGAGKTTTIKLLLGLIKPTSGGGQIFGKDIIHDNVEIRTNIGYLPQDTRFYEHMTARQTLEYTARFFYAGPQSAIDRRVNEMIELVGLEGKAGRPIKGFSGGERQRLGIAQAEVNHSVIVPGVILYISLGLFSDIGWLSPFGFLAALLMVSLHTFYWIALVLMMGTLSESSSVVMAVPMALYFAFWMGTGMIPALIYISPLLLTFSPAPEQMSALSVSLMTGEPVFSWLPLISTVISCAIFIAVAIRRFNRQEF